MAAPNAAILKKKAADVIDGFSSELHELNKKIWKHPELAYEEKFSHDLLTDFLEEQGFSVKRHYSLETAFRATVDHDANKPTVGVICEYDALPEIGHACGHNLIAEAGVAAAIGETVELEVVYHFTKIPVSSVGKFRTGRIVYHLQKNSDHGERVPCLHVPLHVPRFSHQFQVIDDFSSVTSQ